MKLYNTIWCRVKNNLAYILLVSCKLLAPAVTNLLSVRDFCSITTHRLHKLLNTRVFSYICDIFYDRQVVQRRTSFGA